MSESGIALKIAKIFGTLVAEAALQVAVQKILNDEDSQDDNKRFMAVCLVD